MSNFGHLLRQHRLRSRDPETQAPLTQAKLAELLNEAAVGTTYSGATVSNWERGKNQIRRDDRPVLVALVRVLHRCGGLVSRAEAAALLAAGNYRALHGPELVTVNPAWAAHTSDQADGEAQLAVASQLAALPEPSYLALFGVAEAQTELWHRLRDPAGPYLLLLTGLGGSGKTALADSLARRAIEAADFAQVVWITLTDLASESEPESLWAQLARPLLPELAERLSGVQLKGRLRNRLKTARCLLILDDVPADWVGEAIFAELLSLLRPSKMLFTTRRYPAASSPVYVHRMRSLARTDALQLLRHQAAAGGIRELLHAGDADLDAIYQTVGGHPLALSLAARLCRLFPFQTLLAGWRGQPTGHFADTYEQIYEPLWRALTSEQKQLLLALSLGGQAGTSTDQLAKLIEVTPIRLWPNLISLIELCLVETRGGLHRRRYGIHSLTRQYVQTKWRDEAGQLLPEMERLIQHNLTYWARWLQAGSTAQLAGYDNERESILRAVRYSLELAVTEHLRQIWLTIAAEIYAIVERGAPIEGAVGLLDALVRQYPEVAEKRLRLLTYLGRFHLFTGQYDHACERFRQCVDLAGQLANLHFLAQAQVDLATSYMELRRFDKAKQFVKLARKSFDAADSGPADDAIIANLLGNIGKGQGDFQTAQRHFERAVAIWRQLRDTKNLIRSSNNLAQTLEKLGHSDEAVSIYQEALKLLAHQNNLRDESLILLSLGTLQYNQHQYDAAAATFSRINSQYLEHAGLQEYFALVLNNRGNIAYVQGQIEKARTYLLLAATIWRQLSEEVRLANSLSRLGDVYQQLEQLADAEAAYREAIELAGRYPEDVRAREIRRETESDLLALQAR